MAKIKIKILKGDFFYLPPLRFHFVEGCWDRTQDSYDYGNWLSNALTTRLDLIHTRLDLFKKKKWSDTTLSFFQTFSTGARARRPTCTPPSSPPTCSSCNSYRTISCAARSCAAPPSSRPRTPCSTPPSIPRSRPPATFPSLARRGRRLRRRVPPPLQPKSRRQAAPLAAAAAGKKRSKLRRRLIRRRIRRNRRRRRRNLSPRPMWCPARWRTMIKQPSR